ncbi:hypothetical protein N7481_010127 [Penicillium waksmanii]|uniref:uncharacterized protein n=1 Tax=Penicillium waksmanii TaxID=69791 RepID=UPI0025470464|nr:uncharacterized protein N7481_010127 [Penicillium waksmanii]KAJ5976420.1 hypothetical protein N7481_010127 [Penicillium waksmanii]
MLANAAVPATCSSTSAKYSLVSVRRVAISASAPNSSRDRPFDENPAIDASTNLSRSWGSTRRTRTLVGSGRRASRPPLMSRRGRPRGLAYCTPPPYILLIDSSCIPTSYRPVELALENGSCSDRDSTRRQRLDGYILVGVELLAHFRLAANVKHLGVLTAFGSVYIHRFLGHGNGG